MRCVRLPLDIEKVNAIKGLFAQGPSGRGSRVREALSAIHANIENFGSETSVEANIPISEMGCSGFCGSETGSHSLSVYFSPTESEKPNKINVPLSLSVSQFKM